MRAPHSKDVNVTILVVFNLNKICPSLASGSLKSATT